LHEAEEHIEFLLLGGIGSMPAEEFIDDLYGTHLPAIALFAVGEQERQQDACLLDPVERKRCEETVVKLILDAHLSLELLEGG
jgi:hypothetical protein